ncbi:hypothetical protein [Actinomyces wuliandei]|uniref:hypothetical protein n=1 Tax=Actinomyces wuliandei TaxID=2057743 RepID=UPI00111B507B|nr:hypothetical protein [Actinomyces wuliandei]
MRVVGRVLGVVVAVVLLVAVPLAPVVADVVDASENSDDVPKEFNHDLLTEEGGFPPRAGYESQLAEQADLRWSHCLEEIDYAREGAGWGGIGGWVYVSESEGECKTPQLLSFHTVEQPFATHYEISNLDVDALMRELAYQFDFVRWPNTDEDAPSEKEQEDLDLAEQDLAGDMAYDASERNGGGVLENNAAAAAAGAAVGAGASVDQVQAVTNPSGALDELVNTLKEDSGRAISEGLGYVSRGLAFDAGDRTFREAYAAAAGVGMVLLAMGAVVTIARMHRSRLPAEEAVERLLASLVGGMLGLLFTPAMLYVCTQSSDVLSQGVVRWLGTSGESITGSLIDPFNALTTANSPLGYVGAVVICCLFFLAGLMLLAVFATQFLVAYFGAVGLGVVGGLVATERGRRRYTAALVAVVAVIFARPVLLFMVGVAVRLSAANAPSADGWSTDPMGTLFRLVIALGAIMLVCFAPAGLLRFMPVAGSGGGAGRGLAAGLVGGSVAGSMLGSRMRSMAPAVRSAAGRASSRLRGAPAPGGGRTTTASGAGPRRSQADTGRRGAASQASAGAAAPRDGVGGSSRSGPRKADAATAGGGTAGGRDGAGTDAPGRGGSTRDGGSSAAGSGRGTGGGRRAAQEASSPGPGAVDPATPGGGSSGGDGTPVGTRPDGVTASSRDSTVARAGDGPADGGRGAGSGGRTTASAGRAAAGGGSAPSRAVGGRGSRPGSRLTGGDLLAAGSAPRRAVGAAGRVGGAALAAGATAATVTASAARAAGYQGARFAEDVVEEGQ